MKSFLKHIAVIACLLPLLFFNIKNTHDWGDDFAQYLLEAKNLVEGNPIIESGFIENPNYILGPNCYPPGFPIIIALTSFDISKLNILMSFFLISIGYLTFILLNKWFPFICSSVLSLIVSYNPLMLAFKNDVLSDLPYAAFVLLFFVLYLSQNKKIWLLILCGFILTFSIEIRFAGWVLFIAIIIEAIFKLVLKYYRQKKFDKNYFQNHIWIIGSSLLFYGMFYILIPQKITYYPNPKEQTFFEIISINANYNYATLKYFFSCFDEGFLNFLVSYGIIFTALVGMLIFTFKPDQLKPTILLIFFIGHIASIMIHDYSDYGFRLLIPIIPLVLYFATFALFLFLTAVPYKQYVVFSLGLLVLFCYKQHSMSVLKSGENVIDGPYTTESVSTFKFISENLPKEAGIMFTKPRALTYFTGNKTYVYTELGSQKLLAEEFNKFQPDYFLVNYDLMDDSIKKYLAINQLSKEIIYKNNKFELLKLSTK